MLRHIVCFRLKPEEKHMTEEVIKSLKSLAEIPGVKHIEIGADVFKTARSYDIAMTVDFENKDDYNVYDTHALHQPVRTLIRSVVETSVTVDYILR